METTTIATTIVPSDSAVSCAPSSRLSVADSEVSRARLAGIDAMRAVAVIGVTWIHIVARSPWQRWNSLGRFGAEYFAAVAVLLVLLGSRTAKQGFSEFFARRTKRLIFPFVAWCLIYFALRPLIGRKGIDHLWFLPFIFVCVIVAWPLSRLQGRAVRDLAAALLGVVGLLCTRDVPAAVLSAVPGPLRLGFSHSWSYTPEVFWAASLALVCRGRLTLRQFPGMVAPLGALLTIFSLALLFWTARPMDPLFRGIAGMGCVLLAVGLADTRLLKPLVSLGRSAYGVYLIHPCIAITLAQMAHLDERQRSLSGAIVLLIVTVVVSYVASNALSRWRPLAWLIPAA